MRIDVGIAFGQYNFTSLDVSIERVLTLMKQNNIDYAMVCSLIGALYDCAEGNDETAAICDMYNHLLPVGVVSINKLSAAEEEIRRGKERRFRAFRLFNEFTGNEFSRYSFRRLMELLEKYSMPLIVSCTDMQLSGFYGTDIAKAVCGFNVPVIVLNASGYKLAELIDIYESVENIYFTTSNFNVSGAIDKFCDIAGLDRLVFATGLPVLYPGQTIYPLEKSRLSFEQKEKIYSGNLINLVGDIL